MRSAVKKTIPLIIINGVRLALLNTLFILIGGGVTYGLLFGAELLRVRGIPLPPPLWIVLLPLGIAYYVTWFKYGKAFGKLLGKKSFIKGYIVGLTGQIPGFVLIYALLEWRASDIIVPEILRIGLVIAITFAIVLPLMVGLGTLDQK